MSQVDDRIRAELRRLRVEVDGGGAFERVDRRRRHVRTLRRLRLVLIAVAVVAGTAAGGLGLLSVIERADRRQPGNDGRSESPVPRPGLEPVTLCGASSSVADLDGDGMDDRIAIGVPMPVGGPACGEAELEGYVARIELAAGTDRAVLREQPLPECDLPGQCSIFATPDVNDDGRAEVAIEPTSWNSTAPFWLYRFDPRAPEASLRRLAIAPPGDPFNEEFGFPPGPATFWWFGSVTHQHWLSCDEDPGVFAAITVLRAYDDPDDPHVEDVHGVRFRMEGDLLVVESTWDEQIAEGTLVSPPDLCGAALDPGYGDAQATI